MDKLRTYLAERNIPIPVFAAAIEVQPRTAYRYVSGERIPDRDVMPRIVRWSNGALTPNDWFALHGEVAAE